MLLLDVAGTWLLVAVLCAVVFTAIARGSRVEDEALAEDLRPREPVVPG